jgi:hypothetical protein
MMINRMMMHGDGDNDDKEDLNILQQLQTFHIEGNNSSHGN